MADYTKGTGSSGTMMIRDTGSTIEFWISTTSSTTWTDHLPWSGTVNGSSVGGSYYYHPNSGWNRLGSWGVSRSQNITFSIGSTGTSGFGGPTSFTVYINRATVPPAPNPVGCGSITSTSLHAVFTGNGDGGATVDTWAMYYGTDPYTNQHTINTFDTIISGLTPGTTYYFWSRGHNSVGWSAWSARSQATTLNVPEAPSTPVLFNIAPTTIDVSFTPNGTGGTPIIGFQVGYGTDSVTPGSIVSATSPITISGLQPGTTYYFWTRAQNSVGWSSWSAQNSTNTIAGARINVSGVWKIAIPYVKDGGVWKIAHPWGKDAGVWKETI